MSDGCVTARLGRAAVFGGSSTCLAYAAHVAGGGYHPSWLIVAVTVGLVVRVAYGLAGAERGPLALAIGLGATQLALHAAFAVATASPAAHVDAHHHAALLPSGAMTAAHALAAAATALLLRGSEHRIWETARLRRQLRRAVGSAGSAARTGRRQLAAVVAQIADLDRGQPSSELSAGRATAVRWLAATDTSTWRTAVLSERSGRRRGPPATSTFVSVDVTVALAQ